MHAVLQQQSQLPQRSYHQDKDSAYALPNDAAEHIRLEQQASHFETIMNGNTFHAPVDSLRTARILDVGCGTGVVADSLSRAFPSAQIYGLDLSPVPRHIRQTKPNVRFVRGNFMSQEPRQWAVSDQDANEARGAFLADDGAFDFIFSRLLIAGMTQWQDFCAKEMRLLKPGGWVEIQEISEFYDNDNKVLAFPWLDITHSVMIEKGIDFRCGLNAVNYLKAAGFVDVQTRHYRIPFGAWTQQQGKMRTVAAFWADNLTGVCSEMTRKVLEAKGASAREVQEVLDTIQHDLNQEQAEIHLEFIATFGRRPE